MKEVIDYLNSRIRDAIFSLPEEVLFQIEEIRLRSGRPLIIGNSSGEWFVGTSESASLKEGAVFIVTAEDISECLSNMSEKSVYAFQDEIRQGFLTLKNGHRVGICGRAIVEKNNIKSIRDCSGLNIRISREVEGCSEFAAKYILKGRSDIFNTLIISPPSCGKTTLIRDLSRLLGSGSKKLGFDGVNVGLVDERCEIASVYKGTPKKNIGTRTDIIDNCPKAEGILMLLRSMSPKVIITDEIGDEGDAAAVKKLMNSGVRLIATAHGYNISELKARHEVLEMLDNGIFERYVVLGNSCGPGTVEEIIDGKDSSVIYRRGGNAS